MKRVYELDVYKLAEALSDMAIATLISGTKIEALGPKLNAFINGTKT